MIRFNHTKHQANQRLLHIAIAICLAMPLLLTAAHAKAAHNYFKPLQDRLVIDGFDSTTVKALFQNEAVQFDHDGVSRFFRHREGSLNYGQFTTPKNINNAKQYMLENHVTLAHTEQATGVNRQVITAIILVETKLGKYIGNRSIFNTLSTMAALSDPETLEFFWQRVPPKKRLARSAFEKKAQRKSSWAYQELKAFITYTRREEIDPHQVLGSYAGALGISQFMPTSIIAYARDGNQDGRIDLFNHSDPIASIGNYLRKYGWRPGIAEDQAYKVVWKYNRSSYYVKTVLKIAEMLKDKYGC